MEKTIFERVKAHQLNLNSGLNSLGGDSYKAKVDSWNIACKIVELELYARAHVVDVIQGPSALEFIGMELKNIAEK